jgi:hydrogenase maturation protease
VWGELNRPAPESVEVQRADIRKGSRVRLRPRPGGDIMDAALAGRVAIVEGIDQSLEGTIHLAVTLEDDPGRDLGDARFPGHRFFFRADEVEPVESTASTAAPRILVAGIGNIFLGDDGFGVAVAERLAERPQRPGVTVRDFGIRGLDLAYAMQDEYDAAVLIDAVPRGGTPGTLYVIEPEVDLDEEVVPDAHGMDPMKVLRLARSLGRVPPRTRVVGCEPQLLASAEPGADVLVQLSPAVSAAIDEAVRLVESVVAELIAVSQSDVERRADQ